MPRLNPRHRWKVAAAVALPILVVLPWVGVTAATASGVHPEADVSAAGAGALRPAGAALVLGAGVRPDGTPSPFLRDRVEVGVSLYQAGLVEHLLMSGDGDDSSGFGETAVMRALAESLGVPAEAIVEDPEGLDTESSCTRAREVFGEASVIVTTQQFHQPRALWLCEHAGIDAQGVYPPPTPTRHTLTGHVREVAAVAQAVTASTLSR
ncbi:vancomycin high temperature exclusion protein [Demequina sp. NBRC 110051]|uniref:SanA/YdcF family protein n=1 Tax=Demequina sp. NBRC 110051 TaxID=1570340 RepID=UPI0013565542|nr:ElyC/SanA/YdcF family protein [Demequina sp. NBRC 110051]